MRRRIFLLLTSIILFALPPVCIAQANKKLEYGILVDSTGSMRSQFGIVNVLTKALVHQVHDHGPISIFSFDSSGMGPGSRAVAVARIEHTQDEGLLNRTIDGLYVQGGQTTLLDAIEFMDERLRAQAGATDRIIILITDGEDRVSTEKQQELVRKLKDDKMSVYAIGLVRELGGGKR
ncbi:MAG TPA: vWA domain-containing protein [Pyrinomonadaceae bacterium]|nr:vWA domain-containing protein [Pyrinomonadaceae bacterium]